MRRLWALLRSLSGMGIPENPEGPTGKLSMCSHSLGIAIYPGPLLADAGSERRRKRYGMLRFPDDAGILAIDLAMRGFQVRAVAPDRRAPSKRQFSRPKLERFPDVRPVALEACSMAHRRGRVAPTAGRDVRLVAPNSASRSRACENDAGDAEAIATAVPQPGILFVELKSPNRSPGRPSREGADVREPASNRRRACTADRPNSALSRSSRVDFIRRLNLRSQLPERWSNSTASENLVQKSESRRRT